MPLNEHCKFATAGHVSTHQVNSNLDYIRNVIFGILE
jgi:hypothetical protein